MNVAGPGLPTAGSTFQQLAARFGSKPEMARFVGELVSPSKVLLEAHDPSSNKDTASSLDLKEDIITEHNNEIEVKDNIAGNVEIQLSGKHWCFFCKELKSQIARYLQTHSDEPEIQALASLSKKERQEALCLLRKKGDFLRVSSHPQEQVKVVKSSKKVVSADDAKGCPYCFGLYAKEHFYKHILRCVACPQKHT